MNAAHRACSLTVLEGVRSAGAGVYTDRPDLQQLCRPPLSSLPALLSLAEPLSRVGEPLSALSAAGRQQLVLALPGGVEGGVVRPAGAEVAVEPLGFRLSALEAAPRQGELCRLLGERKGQDAGDRRSGRTGKPGRENAIQTVDGPAGVLELLA